ncbi:hypothetical protein, partial [Fulvimarina sp. MAC3]|uniref:hypothetical protein n=1 Tax=Fulvimarina sp. MAC3 TaxID=3148887 RepID=UPI0031FC2962
GLRRDRQGGDRSDPHHHNHESRLIMTSGHPENYTSLTDVTLGKFGDQIVGKNPECSFRSLSFG